jgi:hypothetical protein
LLFRAKRWVAQESLDIPRGFDHRTAHHRNTVIVVTKPATKKSFVTGDENREFQTMEVAEDFFQILPLGSAYLVADLLRP